LRAQIRTLFHSDGHARPEITALGDLPQRPSTGARQFGRSAVLAGGAGLVSHHSVHSRIARQHASTMPYRILVRSNVPQILVPTEPVDGLTVHTAKALGCIPPLGMELVAREMLLLGRFCGFG
jgi:hypothetical protein